MPKPYSCELRVRVMESIEAGATRRETAELFGVSPSVVVIWAQRFKKTGNVLAKPSGGSVSPLEEHAQFLLKLIAEQPGLTLDEVVAAMKKAQIAGSRTAVWRLSGTASALKKRLCTLPSKSAPRWLAPAATECASKASSTRTGRWFGVRI